MSIYSTIEVSKKRAYEWYIEQHLGLGVEDVERALDEELEPTAQNAKIVPEHKAGSRCVGDDALNGL